MVVVIAHNLPKSRFVVEPYPIDGNEQMVTFRVDGTRYYWTQNAFGDVVRAQLLETLTSFENMPFPAEVLREITEFAVGNGTRDGNFEGPGFDYTPMKAVEGTPGILQSFVLDGSNMNNTGI